MNNGKVFAKFGYLQFSRRLLEEEYVKRFTHIIIGYLIPSEIGTIDNLNSMLSWYIEYFQHIHKICKNNGIKVLVGMIGMAGSKTMSKICRTKKYYRSYMDEVTYIVRDYGFDGVDVDWEFPTLCDQRVFVNMFKELRYKYLMGTITASVGYCPTYVLYSLLGGNYIYKYLDYVLVMAYDNIFSKNHSTLPFAKFHIWLMKLLTKKNKYKLVLLIPLYGRTRNNCGCGKSRVVVDISSDDYKKDVYKINGKVYFNGSKTIQKKIQFAKDQYLAGVGYWELTALREKNIHIV